ncbi:Polygalacturonase [Enterobacterales bacterium 8AC]|nr:Polygalacturonase [Enterobacterales bacterium 8AC]
MNIKSLFFIVTFLVTLTGCDNSESATASATNPAPPTEPISPVNPIDPAVPVDPVTPVDPSEPVAPVDPVEPVTPVDPVEPVTPADRSGSWPAAALNDPELVGKEPVIPTVCQTLPAELTQNAKGLLDDAIDADPDNSQPDASRIQAAINACSSGAVKLIAGSNGENAFLSGPLTLKSGVTLWVDQGVTLFASRSPADYQIADKNNCGETASSDNGCNALITATDAVNSGVVGEGIIDGRGGAVITTGKYANTLTWWDVGALTKTVSGANQNNPRLIQVTNKNSAKPTSKNFTLYKITLQNAPKFHFVPSGVNGVTVWGVKVLTPSLAYTVPGYDCPEGTTPATSGSPNYTRASTCFTPDTTKNTDAIDPGQSQNVLIAYNHISTGDDGVAIKSHNSSACVAPIADKYLGQLPIYTVSNVKILHNRLYFTHGMSIGSETDCAIKDVEIRDLTIDGHDAAFAVGVRIKTDMSVGGEVKNVSYDGVCIRRAQEALTIDTYYSSKTGQAYPDIHDITIKNYHYVDTANSIYNGDNVRVTLRGFSSDGQDLPLKNIVLNNTVFDSAPQLANKASGKIPASPSYAQITMGPGPVSFASLLLAAVENGAPEFEVLDNRDAPAESAEAPYDCSQAFALFPSAGSAL